MSGIVVIVSVDWEGRSLLAENLEAIQRFRHNHRDVPLQHFLNPAYFTRAPESASKTRDVIDRVIHCTDKVGLHVHAWHSLVANAGVAPRSAPIFLEANKPVPKARDDWEFYPAEDGYDVPLEAFETDELVRILSYSADILDLHGFGRPDQFRAGAWMAGKRVMEALMQSGFGIDCSAVDPSLARKRFGDIPLCRWLDELWPAIGSTTQPYRIDAGSGTICEIPNNVGLVDYTEADFLVEACRRNIALWKEEPATVRLISTGFHQETARQFIDRLDEALGAMKLLCAAESISLIFAADPTDHW